MLPEAQNTWMLQIVPLAPLLPLLGALLILLPRLFTLERSEGYTFSVTLGVLLGASLACFAGGFALIAGEHTLLTLLVGRWFAVGDDVFDVTLVVDKVAVGYGGFCFLVLSLVAVFSRRYVHREPGFHRFHALLCLFAGGLAIVAFAGQLEILILGWELVGVSSVLLIAFFNARPMPVRNALRAFVTYRLCDTGLIVAALCLHAAGAGHAAQWPLADVQHPTPLLAICALGLILAAMGKGAQVPFSGWLPRAMEGPTPSSAVFYGGLSIHLGPLLLLRAQALLTAFPWIAWGVVVLGLLTALHGHRTARVQTDIKSMLAYGSVTQVGLILAEVGLGLSWIPLIHIIGHAGYRTLQFLRAPSLLHDRHHLEQMLGHHLSPLDPAADSGVLSPVQYRRALARGGLDTWLIDRLLSPLMLGVAALDRLEQRVMSGLANAVITFIPFLRSPARGCSEDSNVA
jgi:NADH:ubiquinone oxidoreductase subunit 5 (subunit L)/multisubunit Na+/H+ antiporter MnhA subunit